MPHPWPLFDLRIRSDRLELRAPTDDDLVALLDVARAGVHDPATMPFEFAWTDLASPAFELSFLRFFWGSRASWSAEAWRLPLAVVRDGQPIGIQEIGASRFPVLRAVETGSWLGLAHQGQGLGTEMRAAVLTFAFEGLGATSAVSAALDGNEASQRISRRLGYRPNGEAVVAPRGRPVTQHRYLLRRADWRGGPSPTTIEHLDACRSMFGIEGESS